MLSNDLWRDPSQKYKAYLAVDEEEKENEIYKNYTRTTGSGLFILWFDVGI